MNDDQQYEEKPDSGLTLKQEAFCRFFASDEEFFGNGVRSYIAAYKPDQTKKGWYNTARARASQLLTNVNILTRINELLESGTLNDAFVDKQLAMLITQNADFGSKVAAIKEYNALKARITKKVIVDDQRDTRLKIKDFLNEPDSDGQSDAASAEPTGTAGAAETDQVAPTP